MSVGVKEVKEGTNIANEACFSFNEIVNASEEVDAQIKSIIGDIDKMVHEIKIVDEMSTNISDIARSSSEGSQQAAAAIQEQTASLEEILSSCSTLADMAEDLKKMVQHFKL